MSLEVYRSSAVALNAVASYEEVRTYKYVLLATERASHNLKQNINKFCTWKKIRFQGFLRVRYAASYTDKAATVMGSWGYIQSA